MKVGFMLPVFGDLATSENMIEMATLAEQKGFESIWCNDHVIMPTQISTPYPYSRSGDYIADPKGNQLESYTSLAFVAGHTSKIKLGFSITVAPYRHPLVTAKMIATIDVLSNGRLIVGVGAGWLNEEFNALGVSTDKKWMRTEEHIRIWKELWTAEEPSYRGQIYNFSDVQSRPQPIQKPHPPISIGGNGKACFSRVITLADGWQVVSEGPDNVYSIEGNLKNDLATLYKMSEKAGRDPNSIEVTAVIIAGTAQSVIEDLPHYKQIGVSRLILDFPSLVSNIDDMAAILEKIADEVAMDGP